MAKRIVYQGDTLAAYSIKGHTTLLGQIADLIETQRTCDSLKRELEYSANLKDANISDLKKNLADKSQQLLEKDGIIQDNAAIAKNKRKMWRNRSIYFGAGGLAVGLLTGLIIAR